MKDVETSRNKRPWNNLPCVNIQEAPKNRRVADIDFQFTNFNHRPWFLARLSVIVNPLMLLMGFTSLFDTNIYNDPRKLAWFALAWNGRCQFFCGGGILLSFLHTVSIGAPGRPFGYSSCPRDSVIVSDDPCRPCQSCYINIYIISAETLSILLQYY